MQNPKLKPATRKDGKKAWTAIYRDAAGKQKWFSHVGTKADAQRKLTEAVQEVERVKLGLEVDIKKGTTVQGLADRYYEFCLETKSKGTAEKAKYAFKALIGFIGDSTVITSVTSGNADDYMLHRIKQGRSRVTVKTEIGAISVAWNQAKRWGLVKLNPWEDVTVKVPQKVPEYLSLEEVQRVLEALEGSDLLPLIKGYLYSGARLQELIYLKWEDVDMDVGRLIFRKTKSGKPRSLFFNQLPKLGELLQEQQAKTGEGVYVFPRGEDTQRDVRRGEPYDPTNTNRRFKRVLGKLGISDEITIHSLRKTFATHLLVSGTAIHIVQHYLGHASVTTTEREYSGLVESFGSSPIAQLPY